MHPEKILFQSKGTLIEYILCITSPVVVDLPPNTLKFVLRNDDPTDSDSVKTNQKPIS